MINSNTGKYLTAVPFIWMVRLDDFIHRFESFKYLLQLNKLCQWKELLSSFQVSGHMLAFHPQVKMLAPPLTM